MMLELRLLSADVDVLPRAIDALASALVFGLGATEAPSIGVSDHRYDRSLVAN